MENLFPALFLIIAAVASALSSAKKNREKAAAKERHQAAASPWAQAEPMAAQAKPAAPMSFPGVPGPAITPTVHAHLQPDCDAHDAPGSLGVTSTEGKDPCHEDQLTLERTYDEPVKAEGGLTFDWSGENMVKAFVMQEILTRPCQRHAR